MLYSAATKSEMTQGTAYLRMSAPVFSFSRKAFVFCSKGKTSFFFLNKIKNEQLYNRSYACKATRCGRNYSTVKLKKSRKECFVI